MMYAFLITVPILVVVPALIWRFAFLLAEMVSRDFNPQIELKGLDRHDLYCFAFVFVGLWFCLLSLSGMIHSGYLYVNGLATNPDNTADLNTHLRYFSAHFVTFAAGIACVLGANSLSKKIARFDTLSS